MKIVIDMQGAQTESHRRGIGRYTRDVVRAFVQLASAHHEVHLALSSPLKAAADPLLAEFDLVPRERIHWLHLPYQTAAFSPLNDWRRAAAARCMREQLDALDADWVWHSSVFEGLNEDAVLPDAPLARASTAAILYDLILLHEPESYAHEPRKRQWFQERLSFMRRADLLLSISAFSRDDGIRLAGFAPERVANMGSSVDPMFAPTPADAPITRELRTRLGLPARFILYSGGFDPRKNLRTLIDAYAALPPSLRTECPLVLAGHIRDEHRHELTAHTAKAGLDPRLVRITGSLSDAELIALYGSCSLFVFPSKLEGFGLPPLEAMACGAPVLASRATSLPEVVGREDLLFDPDNAPELSGMMQRVLEDDRFAASLRAYGIERARTFNPEGVAQRALDAFEAGARNPRITVASGAPQDRAVLFTSGEQLPDWVERLSLPHFDRVKAGDPAQQSLSIDEGACPIHLLTDASAAHSYAHAHAIPGVILLGETHAPVATRTDLRTGLYLGAGYAAVASADHSGQYDPLAALVPMLESSAGVVTQSLPLAERVRALTIGSASALPITSADAKPDVVAWFVESDARREARLVRDIAALPGRASDDDLAQVAYSASTARQPHITRWFVDVTSIAARDIGTGVHRVVRSVLRTWLEAPPAGVRIEPVRFDAGDFRYARAFAAGLLGVEALPLADGIVSPRPGDCFVGLDWTPETLSAASSRLADWRRGGVRTAFVAYDLLPIRFPEWFHAHSRDVFARWLETMTYLSDQVVCISRTTADDYLRWIDEATPRLQFGAAPAVHTFELGMDSTPAREASVLRTPLATAMRQHPTLLMVGTLEPRKGYADALDVADRLWAAGAEFNLVIAGHRGWLVDELVGRLQRHPLRNTRLHWHEDIGDDELGALYAQSTALLAASHGEGYGLPLVEAARQGLPVIARDIPIFREVMGDYPVYLPSDLAAWDEAIRTGLDTPRRARFDRGPTWRESAIGLAGAIAQT